MGDQNGLASSRWTDEDTDEEDWGDVPYDSNKNRVQSPYFKSGSQAGGHGGAAGHLAPNAENSNSTGHLKGRKSSDNSAPTEPLFAPVQHNHSHSKFQAIEQLDGGDLRDTRDVPATATTPHRQPLQTMLRDLVYLEGEIKALPDALIRRLQQFCIDNNTQDLPFAKSGGSNENTLMITRNGYQRKWMALSTYEELQLGRFKYGSKLRFTAAQALAGSDWEQGDVVILVFSGLKGLWKIWRFQKTLSDIPDSDCLVTCQQVSRPLRTPNKANHVTSALGNSKSASVESEEDDEGVDASYVATNAVHDKVSPSVQRRELLPISYVEGEIKSFPARLKQNMQDFLDVNPGLHLSCAQRDWKPDTNLQRTGNGDVRQWITHPQGERLQMGRFRYGANHKILVAQASEGSNWQNGEPKIVVYGGHGNNDFGIWGGQRVLDTIPIDFGLLRWCKVEEDTDEDDKLDDSDMTLEPGSGFRKLRSGLGVRPSGAIQDTAPVTNEPSDSTSIGVPPRSTSSAGLRTTLSAVAKARNARSLSSIKNSKRRRSGGRDGLDRQIHAPKVKKARTGRYSSGWGNMEDQPFEVCIVNDTQHPESVVPSLTEELSRMGRQGGLPRHLRRSRNNVMAEPVTTVEKVPAPPTASAQSLEQAGNVNGSIPIRQSPMLPALGTQSLSTDGHDGNLRDEAEADFDISTTTICFVDKHDQTVLDCPFSDTPDIRHLFARARVAKIATKDTILLEGVVGVEKLLMQKGKQRDFEVLKSAIMERKVMEITVREEME